MDNMVLDCIMKRRSIRNYDTKPIDKEMVDKLVKAALISPSSMNRQPWHISVIQNMETILEWEKDIIEYYRINGPEGLVKRNEERGNKIFYNAPLVFMVSVADTAGLLDVGIVVQSINIAAVSMGLSSVTLGLPRATFIGENSEVWKKKLGFPDGYDFGMAVAVGYGLEPGKDRKPDESKVSYID